MRVSLWRGAGQYGGRKLRAGSRNHASGAGVEHLVTHPVFDRPSLDVSLTTPLICKLLLFPALMLLISLALPLPGVARQALVLQAAAPTAISVLLMAESEHVNVAAPAQLILHSTVLALISVPLWSLLIRPLGGTPGM